MSNVVIESRWTKDGQTSNSDTSMLTVKAALLRLFLTENLHGANLTDSMTPRRIAVFNTLDGVSEITYYTAPTEVMNEVLNGISMLCDITGLELDFDFTEYTEANAETLQWLKELIADTNADKHTAVLLTLASAMGGRKGTLMACSLLPYADFLMVLTLVCCKENLSIARAIQFVDDMNAKEG